MDIDQWPPSPGTSCGPFCYSWAVLKCKLINLVGQMRKLRHDKPTSPRANKTLRLHMSRSFMYIEVGNVDWSQDGRKDLGAFPDTCALGLPSLCRPAPTRKGLCFPHENKHLSLSPPQLNSAHCASSPPNYPQGFPEGLT